MKKSIHLNNIILLLPVILLLLTNCAKREWDSPFDPETPKAAWSPSGLQASEESNLIKITWQQTNKIISGFIIMRNENDGSFTEVARVTKDVMEWNDVNVSKGKKYGYQVLAYAGSNQSNAASTSITTQIMLPTVTTSSATPTSFSTATTGGNVTSDGGAAVTARGVCWGKSQNPDISGNKTSDGTGAGGFTSNLTGLEGGTTYYVRAYATNSKGTSYGNQVTFTTPTSPVPAQPGNLTAIAATCSQVNINWVDNSNNEDGFKLERATSQTGPWTLIFTSGANITVYANMGLTASTIYYYRAFSFNSNGNSGYSNTAFAATPACPLSEPVITTSATSAASCTTGTSGGNVVSDGGSVVTARGVCWSTLQNPTIANSKSSDGTGLGSFTSSITGLAEKTTYYVRAYATNSAGTGYGTQLSFTTPACPQQIVPPTVTTEVNTSVSSCSSAISGGNVTSDGGAPVTKKGVCVSISGTSNCVVETNNGTGTGSFASIITTLQGNQRYTVMAYATNSAGTGYGLKISIATPWCALGVITFNPTGITSSSAVLGGSVTSNNFGENITDRGIVFGTTRNPTTSNIKVPIGTGTGDFSATVKGLTANTTYYVRAYAINSQGTTYGSEDSFVAQNPTGTFTDSRDGKIYKWVQIGTQFWMAENLAWLPSVSPPTTGSTTIKTYYVYGYIGTTVASAKATANYATYGVIYNWPAAMDGAGSSIANPSGVKGACPAGWHLPSDAEWIILENYLGGSGVAGGSLKSVTGWVSPNTGATNSTGFTGLPGGYRDVGNIFQYLGNYGYWWTTSESTSTLVWYRILNYNYSTVPRYEVTKDFGLSIRCIRD